MVWLAICAAPIAELMAAYLSLVLAMRLVGIASIVGGMAIFLHHGGRRITAAGVYSLTTGLMCGCGVWYWAGVAPDNTSRGSIFVAALSIYISSALMYALFWQRAATAAAPEPSKPIPAGVASGLRAAGIALAAFGLIIQRTDWLPAARSQATLAQAAAEVGVVLFAASYVLSGRSLSRSPFRVGMAAAAVLIYYFLIFSGFGRLRLAALVIAICVIAQQRTSTRLLKPMAVAAVIPALLVFAAVGRARTSDDPRTAHSSGSGLGSLVNPIATYGSLIDQHITDGGGSTLTAEAVILVPRAVWPNKPVQLGRTLAVRLAPEIAAVSSLSMAAMPQGEWYYNFGWLGVVIMMLALGLIIRWLDRWLASCSGRDLAERHAIYLFIAVAVLVGSISDLAWGGTATWIGRNMQRAVVLVPVVVWFYLIRVVRAPARADGPVPPPPLRPVDQPPARNR
jgi:hypothetical protein